MGSNFFLRCRNFFLSCCNFCLCCCKSSLPEDCPPPESQNSNSILLAKTSSPKPPSILPTRPRPPLKHDSATNHSNRSAASLPLPVPPHSPLSPPVNRSARAEFSQDSPTNSNRRGRNSDGSTSYNPSSQYTHVGYPVRSGYIF
jgi:hypothetical protein